MPNSTARLVLVRTSGNAIATLHLDTREELFVAADEVQNLAADCHGWNAQAFALGECFQSTMSAANYEIWADAYQRQTEPAYVWLALCQEGENDECIGALCLTDGREAIAPPDEKYYLVGDCTPFSAASFDHGFSCVARMSAQNWQAWLEKFEVSELHADATALLAA